MNINITKEIKKDSLVSHIVLNQMKRTLVEELVKEGNTPDGVILDVKFTVNDRELNLEKFIEHWQSQIKRMICEKAGDIINEKFGDLDDLFCDLQERLKEEINKRLSDWEKD